MPTHSHGVARAGSLLAALSLLVIAPPAVSDDAVASESARGIELLGEWFEAHPEYKEMRSSGWKPYNRWKWFQDTRKPGDGVDAGRLRVEIFQDAKARAEAEPRGAGWFNAGPKQYSGRVLAIDFVNSDTDIVYVGTASGGLWKSTDAGMTWSTSTDDLPTLAVGAVCVLDADPDIVLIGTGEGTGAGFAAAGKGIFGVGMLRSTDAGQTWNTTSLTYPRAGTHGFNMIEENPTTGVILAAASDGLYRSTDQGQTWTAVLGNGNFFDVKWQPGSASRVYCTKGRDPFGASQSDNGVYVSDDDGLTWAIAGVGQPAGFQIGNTRIAVTEADPDVIYAHYVDAGNFQSLGVYRSLDGGATWDPRNTSLNMCGGQGWYNCVIAVDQDDIDRVVAGGTALYVSNNGGANLIPINGSVPFGDGSSPHWDNHALGYVPGELDELWIGTDGGVWRSGNDGQTWQSRRAGVISYQFYDICVAQTDPHFAMGGTQDNGIPGRTDLEDWFESTFVADGMVCNVNPFNADEIHAEWQFGNQIYSGNGGVNWTTNMDGIFGSGDWLTPVDMDPTDGDRLYLSTSQGIFRTTNGSSWSQVSTHRARWIAVSDADPMVVWTTFPNTTRISEDGGDTWRLADGGLPVISQVTKIEGHPTARGSAFLTIGGYGTGQPHVYRTTDYGHSWADVSGDLPDAPVSTLIVDPENPGHWYIGTDTGVWVTTNGGVNWNPYGTGLASVVVADLEIRKPDRKLVAGSYGRGMWETDLAAVPVGVSGTGSPTSQHLMLDRPYPYPAGRDVQFRFAARSSGEVTLGIFDVQGRRVDVVTRLASGNGVIETVSWVPGASVQNGVYFAVLEADGDRVARKVAVQR